MGKQKQQTISRFFTPKPKSPPQQQQNPTPKISAKVTFSPAKRHLITSKPPSNKKPKLSFNQNNLLETSQNPPQGLNPSYTPLEKQVLDLKSQYPDVLLMVEVGYRYRFFGSDAEDAARVLGIYAHMDRNFLTASVPTFRLNVHVRRLVSAGFKVGVVKQTETAAIKAHGENRVGPFGRGLSALYTKATLEAAEGVGGGEEGCGSCSNYLICVVEKKLGEENIECGVRIGVVAVEISTGDVVYGEFSDNITRAGLESVVLSLGPTELLLGEPLSKQTGKLLLAYAGSASNARVERVSRDCFSEGGALAEIMSLYERMGESSDNPKDEEIKMKTDENNQLAIKGILAMPDFSVQALALLIRHLKQFGLERILCLGASFRPLSGNLEMNLSANALQQLEVLRNKSDGSESGSLLQCMNHTLTVFGSRLLKHWVTHPLCDRNMILARLAAVSEIADSMISSKASPDIDVENSDISFARPDISCLLSSVLTTLGRSLDIQRGITRIFHQTATSSEFVTVMQSLLAAAKQLQQLHVEEESKSDNSPQKTVHSMLLRKLILTASSSSIICNTTKLLSSVNKEAAHKGDLLNLFNSSSGLFPEVGEAQMAVEMAKDKLDSLIVSYRKQLRMSKLEFMSVSGTMHLIEVPSEAKVPTDWVKINSTKKTIRYHPPEVLTALDQLSLANEELGAICRTSWNTFLMSFGKYYAEFQSAVQAFAALDCLHSFAVLSRNKNYVRPVFVNDSEPVQIHISAGRHPVMETIIHDDFVPNDTNLHAEGESCQIVTGPNMGGKSCYIRQVALIAIMAQIGSFVPASSAKLHVLDNIYTRMGSSDNIQQGRSTFLEELTEASNIIHNCTSQSLVIMDELGRGTSTHDGVAIAYATLHHILEQKKSMVLFVTHYPKIVEIKSEFPGSIGAYHVSYLTSHNEMETELSDGDVETVNQDVTYLYKLVPGVSEKSFGFKVAQLAQLPDSCIRRAIVMAAKLEADVSKRAKSRLVQSVLKEKLVVNDNAQPCILNNSVFSHVGGFEVLEEYTDLCEELFKNVDAALKENDDLTRCFQCLKRAKSTANKLNSSRYACIRFGT